jgi:hypothetical protein
MRIIRNACSGAGNYIVKGWANVMNYMGWGFKIWNGKDPERTFDEFEPDIYMGDVRFRHRIPKRIKHGKTVVVATVDQWSDRWAFPENAKRGYRTKWHDHLWIRRLEPVFLFHQTSPKGIEIGWNKWKSKAGLDVISLMVAGDTFEYYDSGIDSRFICDIAYVGGYWAYKAEGLHQYLLDYATKYKTLIYGSGWPEGISSGYIADEDVKKLFKSATFVPCIHEPHSRIYGYDIVQRLFMVPLAGGFTISDPIKTIYEEDIFSPKEIIVSNSPQDMREKVEHFIRNPEKRLPYIEKARRRILEEHTYFHRVGKLLKLLDFTTEFEMLKKKMKELGYGVEKFV